MRKRRSAFAWTGALAALLLALGFVAAQAQQSTTAAATPKTFKEDELASLLAPIALYPDTVIAQVLMASTYPIEVIEAHRWLQANSQLKGDALTAELTKQTWDNSVKALVQAPQVLKQMDENLGWMQKLGDAFLSQQKDVMAMIQTLRQKAQAEGNLKSDDHMKVTTQPAAAPAATDTTATAAAASSAPQVIVIESSDPQTVYVPTYTSSVYGYWGYPYYPPYYWPPPVGYPGSGFWWGMSVGIIVGGGGCCWGGNDVDIDWNGGDINIGGGDRVDIGDGNRGDRVDQRRGEGGRTGDRASASTTDRGRGSQSGGKQKWSHNPEHRKGVSYRDNATAQKYDRAGTSNRASAASRDSYRGRSSAGTSNLGSGGGDWRASSTARDLGSTPSRGSTSAGSRDVGSGSRGSTSASTRSSSSSSASRGSSSRGSSSAFGGMSSGSRASSYGSRGGMSRGGGGRGGGRR
jgi:hypothetical protein